MRIPHDFILYFSKFVFKVLMNSRISVLMSIYFKDDLVFLEMALDSILLQSVLPCEIVIVCDGQVSKEHEEIIEYYKNEFVKSGVIFINPRLKVNSGLGKALNFGIDFCTMDYVVRMDSDDFSYPDRLKSLKLLLEQKPDIDVLGSYIEEFHETPGDLKLIRTVPLHHDDIFKFSKLRNPMNHVTVCFKRQSLLSSGSYESVLWHEDYYLWLKMLHKGYKFENVNEVHVAVRVSNIGARRSGITYLLAEFSFLRSKYSLLHFSYLEILKYIIIRLPFRLLPSTLTSIWYKKLRQNI